MTDLEEIFKKAAEIAKSVPEHLQEAAFSRAVDQLTQAASLKPEANKRVSASNAEDLVSKIDRTKYDVAASSRTADMAMRVLRLAANDYGVDALTASEIATILTNKFKIPANTNAVSMALNREGKRVNTGKNPAGQITFTLMAAGETYLDGIGSVPATSARALRTRKKVAKRKTAKVITAKTQAKSSATKKKVSAFGPKAAVTALIDSGFFSKPQRIASIQQHLKDSAGRFYRSQDLAPAMTRLLREGALKRRVDEKNQYEYFI